MVLFCIARAQAGQIACTPSAGFTNCITVTFSGADQTVVIPTGVNSIEVRAWGAAGGGANNAYYTGQGGGAAGGFASGTVAVTPGQNITVVVGKGGVPNSLVGVYGGGAAGGNSTVAAQTGASGGGMSGVFNTAAKNVIDARVIAGGGGGASPGADNGAAGAGGGGGTIGGQDFDGGRSGRGGTQLAGGAAATSSSSCSVLPTAGSQFLGGAGGNSNGVSSNEGGGGGAGGYFGGGGGLCQNSAQQNGAGGGGSSYFGGTGVTGGSTISGANFPYANAACSGNSISGGAGDPYYTAGVGQGSCYGTGGNGQVVVQYNARPITVTKISLGGVGGYTFTGTNGWSSQTITTVASGTPVTGPKQILSAPSTITSITEANPAPLTLTSISCSGLASGGSATPNLATRTVTLDALATAAGASPNCVFTNTKLPTVTITKISNGGVGGFTFTGTNGWTSQTITTVTAGTPVVGATQTLTAASTATTISEAIPSNYALSSVTCSGLGTGGTATPNLTTGALVLDAAATAAGSNIACTFTNNFANYTVVKAVNTASIAAPATLTYTITVKNTGAAPLTGLTTSDNLTQGVSAKTLSTGPTLTSGDTNANNTLDTTETWIYTATYVVSQADFDIGTVFSNVITIGTAQTAAKTSNTVTTTITQTPNIQVTKTANKAGPLVVGDVITYSFLVQNTGNVTLGGIAIAETAFNGTGGTGAIVPAGGAATLAPGASTTFTATYTVTQTDVDTL